MTQYYVVGMVLLAAALLAYVIFAYKFRRPRVSMEASIWIKRNWDSAKAQTDPLRRVMEGAALLERTLQEAGYTGTLGEKWKRASVYSSQTEAVWQAIKLRNRVAHEPGTHVGADDADRAVRALYDASSIFLS